MTATKTTALTPAAKTARLLTMWKSQIGAILPKHLTADRMTQLILVEFEKNPTLYNCTPQSVIGSVMHISQLGLEIGGHRGQAYLVPFRDNRSGKTICTPIIGYRGMCDMARRSGQVSTISASCVYSKEVFHWEKGIKETLVHKPKLTDRGEFIAVYAVCTLRDGGKQFEVLGKDDVEAARKCSKGKREDNPWNVSYAEMAKKTALRRLCKLLPFDVETQTAIVDEEPDYDVPQDVGGDIFDADSSAVDDGAQGDHQDDVDQTPPEDRRESPVQGENVQEILAIAKSQIAAATSNADLRKIDEFFQRSDVSQLCQARAEEIRASRGERSNAKPA